MNGLPPPPPSASAPRMSRLWLLAAAAVPFLAGAFLGYQASYQESLGGLNTLGAGLLAIAIVGLVVVIGLVGLGNAMRPAGRGRMASRLAFATAGLIAAGAAGGAAAVPLLDLGYHPPVVLEARGEASVTLDGIDSFEPRASGRADCRSVADGTDVEGVFALSLGLLNDGLLRAEVVLPVQGLTTGGSISLWIDGASLPEGSAQPFWDSRNPEFDSSPDGTTGRARFEGAAIHEDESAGPAAGSWPATLSGEIGWACGPWVAADATSPSATSAKISVDLSGAVWSATPGAVGRCEFEADGSVWTVTGDQVGSLQGEPLSLHLGLQGDPRRGDEVQLVLATHLPAQSKGASLPFGFVVAATSGRTIGWTDLVTIEEIADGGRTGRLTFRGLPREGTADPAWPATLDGQLSWECG